jgi:hypothetical protein
MIFFNKQNILQAILTILFGLYLITDKKLPIPIANLVDTPLGKVVVVVLSLSLFAYANPLLAILGVCVAYFMINSATMQTGTYGLEEYTPTENKKWSSFEPRQHHKYTLEEEIVKERASQRFNTSFVKTPWRPLLDNTHNASPANI